MKIILVLCVFLTAMPAFAGTFKDNFDDGDLDGWTTFGKDWKVENGKLTCSWSGINEGAILTIGNSSWIDYTFEYDGIVLEKLSDNYYLGHVMRYDKQSAFFLYTAFHAPPWNNPVIGFIVNDQNFFIQGRQFGPELNKWYHLKMVMQGKEAKFYIDDNLEVTYQHDLIPESGSVGILFGGCMAEFDNVIITGSNVPDGGSIGFAIASKRKLTTTWGEIRRGK